VWASKKGCGARGGPGWPECPISIQRVKGLENVRIEVIKLGPPFTAGLRGEKLLSKFKKGSGVLDGLRAGVPYNSRGKTCASDGLTAGCDENSRTSGEIALIRGRMGTT